MYINLHYTLLLLIQTKLDQLKNNINNLHYTLLLLIPFVTFNAVNGTTVFTLHFATINTDLVAKYDYLTFAFTLHFATINTR